MGVASSEDVERRRQRSKVPPVVKVTLKHPPAARGDGPAAARPAQAGPTVKAAAAEREEGAAGKRTTVEPRGTAAPVTNSSTGTFFRIRVG